MEALWSSQTLSSYHSTTEDHSLNYPLMKKDTQNLKYGRKDASACFTGPWGWRRTFCWRGSLPSGERRTRRLSATYREPRWTFPRSYSRTCLRTRRTSFATCSCEIQGECQAAKQDRGSAEAGLQGCATSALTCPKPSTKCISNAFLPLCNTL